MIDQFKISDKRSDILRDFMTNAPIGLAFVDSSLRYVVATESIAALHELSAEEHIGKRVQDVVPRLWPTLEPIFQRVLQGESVLNVDLGEGEHGQARRRWLSSFYPVRNGDEIIGIEVMDDNLTDLRETQSALKSRNYLYTMLAHASQAIGSSRTREGLFERICEIAVVDGGCKLAWMGVISDGRIIPGAKFGEDNGFFRRMQAGEILQPPDTGPRWPGGPTGQAFSSGETTVLNRVETEATASHWPEAFDELQIVSAASFPIHEFGRVAAVLSLYADERDIFDEGLLDAVNDVIPLLSKAMDRFALERQGKEVEGDLLLRDLALQAATQGAVIVDARTDGQPIIYATPAFEQLTGYSTEEIVGQNCRILQGAGTDEETVKAIGAALNAGQGCAVEILNYRKNGEPFWNGLTVTPLIGDDGAL